MNYKELGIFIRLKRKDLKLTQKQFAKKAGISTRSMLSIELGEKTHENTLKKVLDLLGYNVTITTQIIIEVNEK